MAFWRQDDLEKDFNHLLIPWLAPVSGLERESGFGIVMQPVEIRKIQLHICSLWVLPSENTMRHDDNSKFYLSSVWNFFFNVVNSGDGLKKWRLHYNKTHKTFTIQDITTWKDLPQIWINKAYILSCILKFNELSILMRHYERRLYICRFPFSGVRRFCSNFKPWFNF
jgi:hypothetical protein